LEARGLKVFQSSKVPNPDLRLLHTYYSQALGSVSKYAVRVITRNASSAEAQELATLPGVTIFEGDAYNEPSLRKAFEGVDLVFANTNGFAIGEKAEIYWGTRLYELSREFKVKHFVWAGLEYATKLGNYDPKYRTGHLDGKAKVSELIAAQETTPMAWSVLNVLLVCRRTFRNSSSVP
jgi:hypothetical protein